MKKIAIEYVMELREKIREINMLDLEDITFTEKGKEIVDPLGIKNFKFIGLNNVDYVDMRFWEVNSAIGSRCS